RASSLRIGPLLRSRPVGVATGNDGAVTERVRVVKVRVGSRRATMTIVSLTPWRRLNLIARHERLAHADSGANGHARASPRLLRVWRETGALCGHQARAAGNSS